MKIMKIIFMSIFAAFSLGSLSTVYADSNPANDSAALRISIIPNFDRGVIIDTGNLNLDLGSVDMGASTQTVSPSTITIVGNITNTELDLSGLITGGWVFDPNETLTSTGTNQLNVWASFTSISTATAPAQNDEYFRVGTSSGAKLVSNTNIFAPAAVGKTPGSAVGRFESNEGGAGDMDSLSPASRRHVWLYFRLPNTTSITAQQSIQFQFSVRQGP